MKNDSLLSIVLDTLEDKKATDVKSLDVRGISDITDVMVIASGASGRQLKAMADAIVENGARSGFRLIGMEGEIQAEWILVDLGDVVIHLMQPRIREFYQLERLWQEGWNETTEPHHSSSGGPN